MVIPVQTRRSANYSRALFVGITPGWQDASHAWNQPDPGRGRHPRRPPGRHVVLHRPGPHDRRQDLRIDHHDPRSPAREPGAETFADLVDAIVHEITLNGESLDPATAYADSRIALPGLQADNELVVRADCTYSHTGEGLHRFVDPVDDRVYLYSQFEVPDARRVFTTFEQPDLKAPFTFNVTAPDHWKVVSNSPTPEPEPLDEAGERQGRVAVRADQADVDLHHRGRRR